MSYAIPLGVFLIALAVWGVTSVGGRPKHTSAGVAAGNFLLRFALISLPFVAVAAFFRP